MRLLHLKGVRGRIVVTEKELTPASLNSGDSFILDNGTVAIQWNGKDSNADERLTASTFLRSLRDVIILFIILYYFISFPPFLIYFKIIYLLFIYLLFFSLPLKFKGETR